MKHLKGNLFDLIPKGELITPTIAHVVNNKARYGRGFVVELGKRYPETKPTYLNWFSHGPKLGDTLIASAASADGSHSVYVAHMLAQDGVGTDKRRIHYGALAKCLTELAEYNTDIYMPRIGAGLAGGDWKVIEELIETLLPRAIICTL